jgi:hypothetical protein
MLLPPPLSPLPPPPAPPLPPLLPAANRGAARQQMGIDKPHEMQSGRRNRSLTSTSRGVVVVVVGGGGGGGGGGGSASSGTSLAGDATQRALAAL